MATRRPWRMTRRWWLRRRGWCLRKSCDRQEGNGCDDSDQFSFHGLVLLNRFGFRLTRARAREGGRPRS